MPVLQRVSVSLKNILFATDLSSASEYAAAYAKAARPELSLVR